MTDHENIINTTIKLAQARTAQAQAEADLYRTKLGADAPDAAPAKSGTSWAAALFRGRSHMIDVTEIAHDLRADGPKPKPPKRPEQTTHQQAVEQIRATGLLFPQVPGAHLTTTENERNN